MSAYADSADVPACTNGPGAAAVLSAGFGSFLVAFVAILADKSPSIKSLMDFRHATGPLSGVTTCAIAGWLILWWILHILWRTRMLNMRKIGYFAIVLLILGVLLTFPPIADLF
jgi:membrane associated rhomboid family serine protease